MFKTNPDAHLPAKRRLRQHNAKITSQPTKLTTIQSLITVMRNCEKSMVLRTLSSENNAAKKRGVNVQYFI
jgi:hypothetical protein